MTTWQEVVDAKSGHVFVDRFDEGVRVLIMRGPFHLCAYLGIPLDHPLANRNYDDIPLRCHGGLTFGGAGDDKWRPKNFYWYGWDYGHCDDYMIADHHSDDYAKFNETQTKWGVKEVEGDAWSTIYDFKHLMKLAETIANNAKLQTLKALNR